MKTKGICTPGSSKVKKEIAFIFHRTIIFLHKNPKHTSVYINMRFALNSCLPTVILIEIYI